MCLWCYSCLFMLMLAMLQNCVSHNARFVADDLSFWYLFINYMKEVSWLQWRVNSVKKTKNKNFGVFF